MNITRQTSRSRGRRGATIVMLLGLIATVLALSYFMMRSQALTAQVQGNGNLNADARKAAQTGMAVALRKMHDSAWTGISMQVSGTLSSSQSFIATYATGDPNLSPSAPDAADWPYRVTVRVTGTASDPARPLVLATYQSQAVVKLLPRQTPSNPSVFNSALSYTVYQFDRDDFQLQLPSQVKGAVRLQGTLVLASAYPPANSGLSRYLGDLNAMHTNGYADFRPLTGPVYYPSNDTPGSTRNLLTSQLGLTTTKISKTTASGWTSPGAIATYQLYPGGQTYNTTSVASTLANTTLAPDPRTNPLGIFVRNGNVTIGNNVSILGTLIVTGDVQINGTNVTLQAASAPALAGTSQAVQLPVLVAGDDFYVGSGAGVTVRGLVAVFDSFAIQQGVMATTFDFDGRLIVNGFAFQNRTEFLLSSTAWSTLWSLFNAQLSPPTPATIPYYPAWLAGLGLPYTPALTIEPETTSVRYQWKDASNTPYVRNTSDPGLRWTLVRWTEGQ